MTLANLLLALIYLWWHWQIYCQCRRDQCDSREIRDQLCLWQLICRRCQQHFWLICHWCCWHLVVHLELQISSWIFGEIEMALLRPERIWSMKKTSSKKSRDTFPLSMPPIPHPPPQRTCNSWKTIQISSQKIACQWNFRQQQVCLSPPLPAKNFFLEVDRHVWRFCIWI